MSRPSDPHVDVAAEQSGPDATLSPNPEHTRQEEALAEQAHATLLLPKVFLIRHGQSLFNAMYSAHAQLPSKGQTRLNFSSSSSSSGAPSSAPLDEGSLIGGIPIIRDRKPMSDPRLLDAPLTPHGQQQARDAALKARTLGPIDLVLSTPLTRAIQTSLLVFRKEHALDWSHASVPSLDQPLTNVTVAAPPSPSSSEEKIIPIRVIPHHVENLCASCDVGIPLSLLESRFAAEPHLDFETARSMMSDCWWAGTTVGANVSHLVIKRPSPSAATAAAPAAAAAAASSSSAGATVRPASASGSRTHITLKPSASMPTSGLHIVREQSEAIEARTKKLIHYILSLALEHSQGEHKHRPMHLALVGHCGYFSRLSGHSMDNCEILELDWPHVLQRATLKGHLTVPAGMKQSDVGDVRKQAALIRHWLEEMQPHHKKTASGGSGSSSSGAAFYSASNPPPSSNTADLHPAPLQPRSGL